MKKSKNSMSLKTLPLPPHKSAPLELRKSNPILLPAKSTLNLLSSSRDKFIKESITYIPTNDSPTYHPYETQKKRICQQIEQLEEEVNGKSQIIQARKYDKELESYQKVMEETKELERRIDEQKETTRALRQRDMMLDEDERSKRFNLQQLLAQQQYCEEVLQNYKTEYEGQSKLVLDILSLENCNKDLKGEIFVLEESIKKEEKEMIDWKEDVEYQLNEKKTKKKMVQLRMDLMKAEEQADAVANEKYMLKFRQILCTCFKSVVKEKELLPTTEDIEEGMELFICRENALSNYKEMVQSYKNKSKDKYGESLIEEYFSILEKIDALFRKGRIYQDRQILKQCKMEIQLMRMQVIRKEENISENEQKLKQKEEQLEVLLANQSIAAIQCMRELEGRYELGQIKSKLKSVKEEQNSRIKFIKNVYTTFHKKQNPTSSDVEYLNNKQKVREILKEEMEKLKHLQHKHRKVIGEKEKAEEEISMAVSKWQETSNKKKRLKSLYKELSKTSKQIRDSQTSKIQNQFEKKQKFKTVKQSNKQNKENGDFRVNQMSLKESLTNRIMTRKASFSQISKTIKGKSIYGCKDERASLTSMLFSKLTK